MKSLKTRFYFSLLLLPLIACSAAPSPKIGFDTTQLSSEGLLKGVSVSYEFCIPNDAIHRVKVKNIDPKVTFQEGSRGRIGCGKGQLLCLSHTHQKDHQKILKRLAKQGFIEKIEQCFFE